MNLVVKPERLSQSSAVAQAAQARRQNASTGAVHFGPGAFHRAHQAWYFDQLMAQDPRWAITGVSLKNPDIAEALSPQDGLYVLAELDRETRFKVIGSITELLVAPRQSQTVLQRLASPRLGWISATVTEKGYCLDGRGDLDVSHPDIAHDLVHPQAPTSFIGYLVEGLRQRRSAGLPPPVVVSCDNLADNGRLLKRATVQFAGQLDADLARWIEGEAVFPRTMVDSITPATDDRLRALVARALGVADAWPVQRERFTQWVIEDCLPATAPDLASVGATPSSDVGGYERAKLRLLNGAHSSLAYLGLLRGYETVAEAMADESLAAFIETLMTEDIAPTVKAPPGLDLAAYIADVLERFRNPAIRHTLAQIAWDGSKKLPFRLFETIIDAQARKQPLDRLCIPVAAWLRFIARQAKAGIPLVDPLANPLTVLGSTSVGDGRSDVTTFLSLAEIFPQALTSEPRFRNALIRSYDRLVDTRLTNFGMT